MWGIGRTIPRGSWESRRKLPKCFLAPLCYCGRTAPAHFLRVSCGPAGTHSGSGSYLRWLVGALCKIRVPFLHWIRGRACERVAGRLHKYAILDCATSPFRRSLTQLRVRKMTFSKRWKVFLESSLRLHSQKLAQISDSPSLSICFGPINRPLPDSVSDSEF